ncbi:retrovirus-related pol polyprotein from transposon TNT 1-94 [Tanacetum coccineum]
MGVVKPIESVDRKEEMEDRTNGESSMSTKEELTGDETRVEVLLEIPRSRHIGYYLKHEINEKLIEGPMYNAVLNKKVSKKDDMEGNFVIPCSIGRLRYVNSLIDQGSDVNIMPMSFYNILTNEKSVGTDIRLSLASHSYIYLLEIVKDVLIDIASYVYPVDFVILDIKEDENKPFILGTPFLTTANTVIRFDKGTITLKCGKNKIDFIKIPEFPSKIEKKTKEGMNPVAPTNTVNRLILEWEEIIKYHQEKEMGFNQWRSTVFDDKCLVPGNKGCGVSDEGGVT